MDVVIECLFLTSLDYSSVFTVAQQLLLQPVTQAQNLSLGSLVIGSDIIDIQMLIGYG